MSQSILGVDKGATPSELPFPVFVMCAPTFADTKISNNAWMTDEKDKSKLQIDNGRFMSQWFDLYQVLSAKSLIYLIPPVKGLQDQVYVNSFVCLHDGQNVILSNFTAKGRAGEEEAAAKLLRELSYNVHQCPFKFEGFPELKYSGKDNTYYGGYGIRTDIKTLEWIEQKFGLNIIKIKETDPYLYHLDCSVFIINKDNVIAHTDFMPKKTIKEIEKVAEIHYVSKDAAYQGVCNSIKVGDMVVNASSISTMKDTDKYYDLELKKNEELEAICINTATELMYVDLSEAMKSGALASCCMAPLNYRNLAF